MTPENENFNLLIGLTLGIEYAFFHLLIWKLKSDDSACIPMFLVKNHFKIQKLKWRYMIEFINIPNTLFHMKDDENWTHDHLAMKVLIPW